MKLYSVSDGPPSLACRQTLKALNIDYELINVDFGKGEHMTDVYAKVQDLLNYNEYFLAATFVFLIFLVESTKRDSSINR